MTSRNTKGSFQAAFFKRALFLGTILVILAVSACSEQPKQTRLSGPTMGTRYNVVIVGELRAPDKQASLSSEQLQQRIDARLAELNQVLSTYVADSELSQLNRNPSAQCIAVSDELRSVLVAAQSIAQKTGGAFDVTIGPLVNAWGFGPEKSRKAPNQSQLDALKQIVGYQKLALASDCVTKASPDLYIDLSAIAKGYGTDQIAELLETFGAQRYLVEIGGEIRVKGKNAQNIGWGLAVEVPEVLQRNVHKLLRVETGAVATSGDYRNYFEEDGVRFSHTIDPITGKPVTHKLASVTVVAETAMLADATATAISVLGPEQGLQFAEQEQLAVLMLVKTADGFEEISSSAFNKRFTQE